MIEKLTGRAIESTLAQTLAQLLADSGVRTPGKVTSGFGTNRSMTTVES